MSAYLERRECPICGAPATNSSPAVGSSPTAESLEFGTQGRFLSGYTSHRVFFTYNRCRECGGLFCPTYFTQAQLDELYAHQPENLADVPQAAREATARAYVDLLRRYSPLKGEYLELGPDIGLFTAAAVEAGALSALHLYEPNRDVHAALAARLRGSDARISAELYRAGALRESSIGVAVAIHVLDHLIDPASMLQALHRDVAPGGRLLFVTHDQSSLLARALGRRWPPYTLQHPHLFTPRTIRVLLERCGFGVVDVKKSLNYFPVSTLARAAMNIVGIERWPSFLDLPWQIGLRLGNIATIAAR